MVYYRDEVIHCGEYGEREKEKPKDSCVNARHPKPKEILLECGSNPRDAIFEVYDYSVKCDQSFVLDRVSVDATCLFRPAVKIEFSSIIFFEAKAWDKDYREREIEVDLEFELERNYKGIKDCVQTWRYIKQIKIKSEKLEIEFSEPFTVTFCDKVCPDCCEYKMIVKGIEFEGCFNALRVVSPNISAVAQGIYGE
jgi:hypothetical protein